jgi:hypothetical protein
MSRHVVILLGFFLGAALLGSIGAFLYYVAVISWITGMVVLTGMVSMFLLGVHTGGRRIRVLRNVSIGKTIPWSLKRAG